MLEFDWTVTIGNLLTIISFLVVGSGFIYAIRAKVDAVSTRLLVIEKEIHTLVDILIQQGRQDERMTAMDARIANQGARLDDITRRFNDKLEEFDGLLRK